MPSKFVQKRALKLVEVGEVVDENKEKYGARWRYLLEEDELDPAYVDNILGELYEDKFQSAGQSYADAWKNKVMPLVDMSWRELHRVELDDRNDFWADAEAIQSLAAKDQAMAETIARKILGIGEEMGEINETAAKRMTKAQKRKMAKSGGIKETVREIQDGKRGTDSDTGGE